MSRELRAFSATIPAGTPLAAPVTRDLSFPSRVVDRIDIMVPPGNNGLVGFQIANAGIAVIPANLGGFLTANGETLIWPLEQQIDSGSWQLIGYNLGVYDHTLYVRFLLSLVQEQPGGGGLPSLAGLTQVGAGQAFPGTDLSQPPPPPLVLAGAPAPPILTNPPPEFAFVPPPPGGFGGAR